MSEDLIMATLGFVVAYFIVRAIRSFRTTGMCLVLGLMLIEVKAQNTWSARVINNGANQITAYWQIDYPPYTDWQNQTINGGGTGSYVGLGSGYDSAYKRVLIYDNILVQYVATNVFAKTGLNQEYTYGSAQTYTNYCGTISFTNNTSLSVLYSLSLQEMNGTEFRFTYPDMKPWGYYEEYLCFNVPWKWSAQPLIASETPIDPVRGTNNTPIVNTNNPPTPPQAPAPPPTQWPTNDVIGTNVPLPNPINVTNQIGAERQNTLIILDGLGKVVDAIHGASWSNVVMNTNSSIDYRPHWQTNNLQGQAITNLLSQIKTNTEGADGNVITQQLAGTIGDASNYASGFVGGMYSTGALKEITNFTWRSSATTFAVPQDDYLSFTLGTVGGVTHKIDVNYEHWLSSSLVSDVVYFANWIQFWLSWVIALILYICVVYRIDELWPVVWGDVRENTKVSASATGKGMGVKMVVGLPLIAGITALLVVLPTVLTILWQTTGLYGLPTNPMSGMESPIDQVNAGAVSGIGAKALKMLAYFGYLLTMSIPYGTAMVAFMNWIIFYQVSRFICNLLGAALWFLQKFLPVLAVVLISSQVEAVQIRMENLLDTPVAISNGSIVLVFGTGVTRIENLSWPGQWNCGSTNFSLPDSGKAVLRVSRTLAGQIYWEGGAEDSSEDWWMRGLGYGFAIFGAAWAVSATWQGWKLRHGGE